MKIALYTSADVFGGKQTGGIQRFAALTEFINTTDLDSILYSRDNESTIESKGIKNFVKMMDAKETKSLLPPEFRYVRANTTTIKEIKKKKSDAIVIFDVPTATGPLLYGLKNVVLMIRKDMIGYEKVQNKNKSKWLKICFQWICESICMAKATLIITQCHYDKDILKGRHPLLAKKIDRKTVVQINNVNPPWIMQKSEKTSGNISIQGGSDKFRICFIGGFDNPRKGQDLFLAAATEVLKNASDVQFVLIGGGRNLDEYKRKYESDEIVFLGRQENPLGLLKQCNLLIVPSYADSCPNTVMEALYNGVPVIGSNAGGIPEILVDKSALFDLDVNSLKERILEYKTDKEALFKLKERQMVRKEELKFDWASRIVDIICGSK